MTRAKKRLFLFSFLTLILVGIAVFAPWIAPKNPLDAVLGDAIQAPSHEHLFGTDKLGRDIFSRVIYGTRTSLATALGLVVGVFVIGSFLGILCAYVGGWLDEVIMCFADIMVSFPDMALALALSGIMGPSIKNAMIAIIAVSWTKYARLARSMTLKMKYRDDIVAARVLGTKSGRILWRYILPSTLPTLVITAGTDVGSMILNLAGLSFLGLGAQATNIEWGYMLNEGRAYMESAPWLILFPGLAIFITVVILNLLGDALRDVLDPRSNDAEPTTPKKRRTLMKLPSKKKTLACLSLAVVLSLSACSGGGKSGGVKDAPAQAATHLNFACTNFSDSVDPVNNVNASWNCVRFGIGENLFKFDKEVKAQPNLAEKIESSEDLKTWIITLKDGIKFSNGKEMTATAVKASLDHLYDGTNPDKGGTGSSTPTLYMTPTSITADDAKRTVTLAFDAPIQNVDGILAYPFFCIIDAEAAEKGEIIGTGFYKLEKFNEGVGVELAKNENYWGGEVPYETVSVIFAKDSSTKAMALRSGDVDVTENITTESDVAALSRDDTFYVSEAAGVRLGNAYFNYKGVLANKTLREAILTSLDYDTMANVTAGGMYTPGISVLPSSLDYHYDHLKSPYTFDVEKAKKILDDAGIVDKNGNGIRELDGKDVDLKYVAYDSRNLADFAQATAIALHDIGIGCTVQVVDYDTAIGVQGSGDFDMITANTTTVGEGDPQSFLGGWYSKNSHEYGWYKNHEYDKTYEELLATFDEGKRKELIEKLQQILIDDAATIVYGYYNSRMFSRTDRVTGADIATIDYYWLTPDIKPVTK